MKTGKSTGRTVFLFIMMILMVITMVSCATSDETSSPAKSSTEVFVPDKNYASATVADEEWWENLKKQDAIGRQEREARLQAEAEKQARIEAEEKARIEAEEAEKQAIIEAEIAARIAEEEKIRQEKLEEERIEAERIATIEAEEQKRLEAEAAEKAREEAEAAAPDIEQLWGILGEEEENTIPEEHVLVDIPSDEFEKTKEGKSLADRILSGDPTGIPDWLYSPKERENAFNTGVSEVVSVFVEKEDPYADAETVTPNDILELGKKYEAERENRKVGDQINKEEQKARIKLFLRTKIFPILGLAVITFLSLILIRVLVKHIISPKKKTQQEKTDGVEIGVLADGFMTIRPGQGGEEPEGVVDPYAEETDGRGTEVSDQKLSRKEAKKLAKEETKKEKENGSEKTAEPVKTSASSFDMEDIQQMPEPEQDFPKPIQTPDEDEGFSDFYADADDDDDDNYTGFDFVPK